MKDNFNYKAQDWNGSWWAYEQLPCAMTHIWMCSGERKYLYCTEPVKEWKKTLEKLDD